MDNLPVRKIYIDSRFKTKDSASNSDFKYELSTSVALPENCVCFVDDVIIPNSWYTIDENNNRLYVRRFEDLTTTITDKNVTLPTNNYTAQSLKDELKNQLDDEFGGSIFTVTYNHFFNIHNTNRITKRMQIVDRW